MRTWRILTVALLVGGLPAVTCAACGQDHASTSNTGEPDEHVIESGGPHERMLVIVTLDVSTMVEAELDAQGVVDQRGRIVEAQEALIAAIEGAQSPLEPDDVTLIRSFEVAPVMVFEVTSAGLQFITDSDLVLKVEPDEANRPLGS
jgi:hypothetical protein